MPAHEASPIGLPRATVGLAFVAVSERLGRPNTYGGHRPSAVDMEPGHLLLMARRWRARPGRHRPGTAMRPGSAGLRAVRDLADVVFVCVKAVESVVNVLARPARTSPTTTPKAVGLPLRLRLWLRA